jgi:hypothetical protein
VETGLFDAAISSVFIEIIHNSKPGENNRLHAAQVTRASDASRKYILVKTYVGVL